MEKDNRKEEMLKRYSYLDVVSGSKWGSVYREEFLRTIRTLGEREGLDDLVEWASIMEERRRVTRKQDKEIALTLGALFGGYAAFIGLGLASDYIANHPEIYDSIKTVIGF